MSTEKIKQAWLTLGLKIVELRTAKGFSQAELSRRTGLTREQVRWFEKGMKDPCISSLIRILIELDSGIFIFHNKPFTEKERIELKEMDDKWNELRDEINKN